MKKEVIEELKSRFLRETESFIKVLEAHQEEITKLKTLHDQKIKRMFDDMCVACLQEYYEKRGGRHIISRKDLLKILQGEEKSKTDAAKKQ